MLFMSVSVALSWDFLGVIRSHPEHDTYPEYGTTPISIIPRISHQAASDPHQDVVSDNAQWYDADGIPLFYSAWRAKPGPLSPEPTARSTPLKRGARVACWPSSGGIWIKHADLVEMEFLSLNRLKSTPRQYNQTAEDEFCTKLKMVGAEWWQLPPDFGLRGHLGKRQYACETLESCFTPDVENRFLLAWPETRLTACYVTIELAQERGGETLGGYWNAIDMEERCAVIRGLGGRECRCKAECSDLGSLDWSFRDPGDSGCDAPQIIAGLGVMDGLDPAPIRGTLRWVKEFCERNGWNKRC